MSYDAIIIGSRVAGAATALLLARRGYRVLIVDRATLPSDTISTHIIWHHGVSRLMDWGLGDGLCDLKAPPIEIVELDFGEFTLSARPPSVGVATKAYAPRRTVFDKMLLDAAAAAGATVRDGFSVEDVVFDGKRVTGVRGHSKSGGTILERATVVIGADGVHSTTARAVQAPEYNEKPSLTCWYYSYWSGISNQRVRFFSRPGRALGCIPTNDGCVCVAVAWPHDQFGEVKKDIESHYIGAFHAVPSLREELLNAKREDRFYGTPHIPNYFRKPYGPGWALVGDAGYNKDPILAQGISDAFRDASLLTAALDDVFGGRAEWDEALGGYESARNKAVEGIYGMTLEFASLEPPPPETLMLIQALRGNQADTDQFVGTMTGAVPVEQFFAPDNIQRILETARQEPRTASAH